MENQREGLNRLYYESIVYIMSAETKCTIVQVVGKI